MPDTTFYGGYDQEEFIDASSIGAGSTIVGQGGAVTSGQENLSQPLSEGSAGTSLVLGAGSNAGAINITQSSPQDVALAAAAYQASLDIVQGAQSGLQAVAQKTVAAAGEAIKDSTQGGQVKAWVFAVGALIFLGISGYALLKARG